MCATLIKFHRLGSAEKALPVNEANPNPDPISTPARRPLAGDEAASAHVLRLHGTKIEVLLRGVPADVAALLSTRPVDSKAAGNILSSANPTKPAIKIELNELKSAGATTLGDIARYAICEDLGLQLSVCACAYLTLLGEGQHRS